jgi:hypothetical protein
VIHSFNEPTEEQVSKYNLAFSKDGRGSAGPLQTAFVDPFHTHAAPLAQTLDNMGIKALHDPYNGDVSTPNTVAATIYTMHCLDHRNLDCKRNF